TRRRQAPPTIRIYPPPSGAADHPNLPAAVRRRRPSESTRRRQAPPTIRIYLPPSRISEAAIATSCRFGMFSVRVFETQYAALAVRHATRLSLPPSA